MLIGAVDKTCSEAIPWLLCGNTTILQLAAVKLEGRKQITAAEFANGARLTSGDSFK
jgi:hypothetical protein